MLLLLCILILTCSACAAETLENKVIYGENENTQYAQALADSLEGYTVEKTSGSIFNSLKNGAAAEVFGAQAMPAVESGIAKFWYPQIRIKCRLDLRCILPIPIHR